MVDLPAAVRDVAAAFLTLSSIAVILRCYVRLRIVKAFGWDDGVMIVAMVSFLFKLRVGFRVWANSPTCSYSTLCSAAA